MDPPILGYPYARPRSFLRLRHKVKVMSELSPLSSFSRRFHRAVNFAWKDVFFMTEYPQIGVVPNEATTNGLIKPLMMAFVML